MLLANACRFLHHGYLSIFYSNARFIVELHDSNRASTREAYYDWIANLDVDLASLVKHLVIDTEIELERIRHGGFSLGGDLTSGITV